MTVEHDEENGQAFDRTACRWNLTGRSVVFQYPDGRLETLTARTSVRLDYDGFWTPEAEAVLTVDGTARFRVRVYAAPARQPTV